METKESGEREIAHDFSPLMIIYKDGTIKRLQGIQTVPPVQVAGEASSKDVIYSSQLNLRCRVYVPGNLSPGQKLPLLVYYHGGAFALSSPFSPIYHSYVVSLVKEANVVAVSVDYRLAPENPIPAAYDDSWAALEWVAAHCRGDGPEEWLNSYADLSNVFLAGDSAGANICHCMCTRNAEEDLDGVRIVGCALINPFFWGNDPVGNEPTEKETREFPEKIWKFVSPASDGCNDRRINPHLDPKFGVLSCRKVLVVVAELDLLRDRGVLYYEKLRENQWDGVVEFMEVHGEQHVFHLFDTNNEKAIDMLKRVASFIKED